MQETFQTTLIQQNQLKHQLKIIFIFYASFGDRSNVHYLKSSKLHKLMSDSQVIDNQNVTKNNLDLLFVQLNKTSKNMDFKKFLEFLPKLAQLKYPGSVQENSLELLLQNNLFPLYQSIMTQTDLGEDYEKFSIPIQEDVFMAFQYIGPVLIKIYQTYFGLEKSTAIKPVDLRKKSETILFHFIGLFEICPELITKSTAYLIFNNLIESQDIPETEKLNAIFSADQGRVFTFYKFSMLLIRVALICFEHQQHLQRMAALLEKMERSSGFNGFQKQIHSPHNAKMKLCIDQHILMMVQYYENILVIDSIPLRRLDFKSIRKYNENGQPKSNFFQQIYTIKIRNKII